MSRVLSCAVLASTLLAARPAAAQPATRGDDEASRLLKEGKTLFIQGNLEEAYARYVRACALAHTPNCLRALAMTEVQTGRVLDGYRHFREWQTDPKASASLDPKALEVMKQLIQQAYDKTGHITVRGADGAPLSVDGQPLPANVPADPVDVPPGPHVIEARVSAGTARANVIAKPGEIVLAELRVDPPPAAAAAQPTAVQASATLTQPVPDAVVLVGRPYWTTRRWIGVGAAGVGVASLLASEIFNIQSTNAGNDAAAILARNPASACATSSGSAMCVQLNNDISSRNNDATLSRVFLGVGIVSIAAGAALILWPDSGAANKTAIEPMTTPRGGGGLQLRGEF